MTHADEPRVLRDASSESETLVALGPLTVPAGSLWDRLPWIGVAVGVLGLAASWVLPGDPRQLAFSWLVAALFFLSLGLGALFFVLVHYAANAGWGVAVRRVAENASATLPLLGLLALPALWNVHALYEWSHPDVVAGDAILQGKQAWLNDGFFRLRALGYLTVWSALAWFYARGSWGQDRQGGLGPTRRAIAASGPAIGLFGVTVTFAAFDWIMSLEPHWYSTILGVYFFAGCLVGAFALIVLVTISLDSAGHFGGAVTVEHFHELGKLLFAFTVFWAYIGFSQFLLIWYANLPEETVWYLRRLETGWRTPTLILAVGHFVVPFFFLMSRKMKRRRTTLAAGAVWMLAMHLLDLHWLVMPTLHPDGPQPGLLDLTTLVGIGGMFLAGLAWLMRRQALIPVRDPRLAESLHLENA